MHITNCFHKTLHLVNIVVTFRSGDSTERLMAFAEASTSGGREAKDAKASNAWRELSVEERLKHSLVKVGTINSLLHTAQFEIFLQR